MKLFAFVPIFVTLFSLLIIISIAYGIGKIVRKYHFTFSIKKSVLLSYLGLILLISSLMIIFVQPKIEATVDDRAKALPDMYMDVLDGKTKEDLPSKFVKEEWTMSPQSNSIHINMPIDEVIYSYPDIVVEKYEKEEVEVTLFETPSLIGSIDISSEVPLTTIEINDDENITFSKLSEEVDIEFYYVGNDVVYNQFLNEQNKNWEHDIFNFESGSQLLYIKIPKDMEIHSKTDEYIHYIDE